MAKKDILKNKVVYNRKQNHQVQANYAKMEAKKRIKAEQTKCKDTMQRKNIHEDIKLMLHLNKGKIEILTYLINKYPNTYLSKFFESWIDYHINKKDFIPDNKEER